MQVQFYYKQMKSSQALQAHTEKKLNSIIMRYEIQPIETRIAFSIDNLQSIVQCSLLCDGFSLHVEHVGDDMYKSVDCMCDKLKSQIKRKKEKLKDHRPKPIPTLENDE